MFCCGISSEDFSILNTCPIGIMSQQDKDYNNPFDDDDNNDDDSNDDDKNDDDMSNEEVEAIAASAPKISPRTSPKSIKATASKLFSMPGKLTNVITKNIPGKSMIPGLGGGNSSHHNRKISPERDPTTIIMTTSRPSSPAAPSAHPVAPAEILSTNDDNNIMNRNNNTNPFLDDNDNDVDDNNKNKEEEQHSNNNIMKKNNNNTNNPFHDDNDDFDDIRKKNNKKEEEENNDDEDDDDEENLDDMLANMDIDNDFGMSIISNAIPLYDDDDINNNNNNNERSTNEDNYKIKTTHPVKATQPTPLSPSDIIFNTTDRDAVFSKRYNISKDELNGVKQLESVLQIHKLPLPPRSSPTNTTNTKYNEMPLREQWDMIVHPQKATESKPSTTLLLKHDICPYASTWNTNTSRLSISSSPLIRRSSSNDNDNEPYDHVELYLFPRGLIIVYVYPETSSFLYQKVIPRKIYQCIYFDVIQYVTIVSKKVQDEMYQQQQNIENAINDDYYYYIQMEWNKKYGGNIDDCITVGFHSNQQRMDWMNYLRKTILYYHMMYSPLNMKSDIGWQYQYVYTPAYTMAVTTLLDPQVDTLTANQYDCLDEYNGYGPIHYAVKYNHIPAIKSLLDAGCNVNLLASDNIQTPMYIAIRDELPKSTVSLLQSYGAEHNKYNDIEKNGELFSKVDISKELFNEKKEQAAAEEKAEKDKAAEKIRAAEELRYDMKNNMNKLQQRGEQINELSDKANALNDGASEFNSMASQIKQKMMKKKWYNL